MKAIYRFLTMSAVGLFTVSILGVAYVLYQLPGQLATTLTIVDFSQQVKIESVTQTVNLVVGVGLSTGLLAIVLLLSRRTETAVHNTGFALNGTATMQANDSAGAGNGAESNQLSLRLQNIESLLTSHPYDQKALLDKVLSKVCNELEACQGAVFLTRNSENIRLLELSASYAYYFAESKTVTFEFGEGLVGQVAKEGKFITVRSVPKGYLTILSGLGSTSPGYLAIAPLKHNEIIVGVMEIASFKEFSSADEEFIQQVSGRIASHMYDQLETVQA
jgi:hypothetical protein